ncbi:MAG: Stp1/IreP family PP2C-type Ser/Thr phosphatase [Defluviitaleaceae bacterium]|nr:Stp1/IreP family PP2C-type Ser/Thr phosphatase [Defluviitaleaceae bacterium]
MLQASVQTNVGKIRASNQDTVFVSIDPVGPLPNLFIVADGMGGHNGGEIASSSAVTYFCDYILASGQILTESLLDILTAAAVAANTNVLSKAKESPDLFGMGTTFTACTIFDNKCIIVHVGDSRAYAITSDSITQLTNDHSYVNEMVKAGQITESEAREHPKRNVLTRVLGINSDMSVDGYVHIMEPGSIILLCSDGLYNMVPENEIKTLINTSQESACDLVTAANDNGGADNISVIVVKVLEVIP